MTKARWWILRGAALLVVGGSAGYIYRAHREVDQVAAVVAQGMLQGWAGKGVEPELWSRVHVGMTKHDVEALLGEAPAKRSTPEEQQSRVREWWEYGYVSSIFAPAPNGRAHVVYFDGDGRVISIREPTR